jgi:hypothetical protein
VSLEAFIVKTLELCKSEDLRLLVLREVGGILKHQVLRPHEFFHNGCVECAKATAILKELDCAERMKLWQRYIDCKQTPV